MRFLTWNLNHRTISKKMPDRFAEVIEALAPDVAVFTEYVPGLNHHDYRSALSEAGLRYTALPTFSANQNHVLVASRYTLSEGNIYPPLIAEAVPSNALHIRIPDKNLEFIGMRIPDYSRLPSLRRACWDWIEGVGRSVIDRPFVFMGDFNTDPRYSPARCGHRITRLITYGWKHATPHNAYSYWTPNGDGVAIDHMFFSPHFQVHNAKYIREVGTTILAGKAGALSDHAALLVEAECM